MRRDPGDAFIFDVHPLPLLSGLTIIAPSEAGTQEAVIKFDCGASASTACLLNNALVDSAHITIKSLPSVEERKSASPSSQAGPASPKDMVAGFFASAWSYGATLAGSVAESAKQFDEQHKITDKVSHAAATAWTATVDTATTVDEKLKISETTTKLFEDVKTKVGVQPAASPAAAGSTGPAGDAPSPRPASAKPASPK